MKSLPLLLASLALTLLVHAQPANDTRAGATFLEVGETDRCLLPLGVSTADALPSLAEPACAPASAQGPRPDLWYAFVATAPSVTLEFRAVGGPSGTLLVSADEAGGRALYCGSVAALGGNTIRLDGLTGGDTVYVQVLSIRPDVYTAFTLCAYETPACLPPTNVSMYAGDTYTRLFFSDADGEPAFDGGRYRVLAGRRPYRRPGLDPPDTTVVGDGNPITVWGLEPGTDYDFYIQQVCSDTDASDFAGPRQRFGQQQAFSSTPNDSLRPAAGEVPRLNIPTRRCVGAPATTRGATLEAGLPTACAGVADDDLWFRIRPDALGDFLSESWRFIVTPAPGISADLVMEFYDEDLVLRACVNEVPGGGSEVYDAVGLPLDEDLFVRVYTAEADAVADFEICTFAIDQPILTDTGCTDAITVTLDGTGAPGELVDVISASGELVVSIENTQDLGRVQVSYFGGPDSLRAYLTDTTPVFYGRNSITIEPERQPEDSLTVRYYLNALDIAALVDVGAIAGLQPEIQAIPNEVNGGGRGGSGSGGRSGGRSGENRKIRAYGFFVVDTPEVAVTRVPLERCSADYLGDGFATSRVASGPWGDGVYVDIRVAGFSEFFFSGTPLSTEIASGVGELAAASPLEIFPNPSSGEVRLRWGEGLAPKLVTTPSYAVSSYTVTDLTGRTVLAGALSRGTTEAWLSLGVLPKGVYVVTVAAGGQRWRERVVLE